MGTKPTSPRPNLSQARCQAAAHRSPPCFFSAPVPLKPSPVSPLRCAGLIHHDLPPAQGARPDRSSSGSGAGFPRIVLFTCFGICFADSQRVAGGFVCLFLCLFLLFSLPPCLCMWISGHLTHPPIQNRRAGFARVRGSRPSVPSQTLGLSSWWKGPLCFSRSHASFGHPGPQVTALGLVCLLLPFTGEGQGEAALASS